MSGQNSTASDDVGRQEAEASGSAKHQPHEQQLQQEHQLHSLQLENPAASDLSQCTDNRSSPATGAPSHESLENTISHKQAREATGMLDPVAGAGAGAGASVNDVTAESESSSSTSSGGGGVHGVDGKEDAGGSGSSSSGSGEAKRLLGRAKDLVEVSPVPYFFLFCFRVRKRGAVCRILTKSPVFAYLTAKLYTALCIMLPCFVHSSTCTICSRTYCCILPGWIWIPTLVTPGSFSRGEYGLSSLPVPLTRSERDSVPCPMPSLIRTFNARARVCVAIRSDPCYYRYQSQIQVLL